MMIADAIRTKFGNWKPAILHSERTFCRMEYFPRKLRRTKKDALACAENIIIGRRHYAPIMTPRNTCTT